MHTYIGGATLHYITSHTHYTARRRMHRVAYSRPSCGAMHDVSVQIKHYGQTPSQLLTKPHPSRLPREEFGRHDLRLTLPIAHVPGCSLILVPPSLLGCDTVRLVPVPLCGVPQELARVHTVHQLTGTSIESSMLCVLPSAPLLY